MSELGPEQSDKLAEFQSLTGMENIDESIQILSSLNWDLNKAVNKVLEEKNKGVQQEGNMNTNMDAQDMNTNMQSMFQNMQQNAFVHNLNNNLAPILNNPQLALPPLDNIFNMFNNFNPQFLGINSFVFVDHTNIDIGNLNSFAPPRRESNTARFQLEFEKLYGTLHPKFFHGTIGQAIDRARTEIKFLLVYIHSNNPNGVKLCKETLCKEETTEFINEHFVFWADYMNDSEGAKACSMFAIMDSPSLTAVFADSTQRNSLERLYGFMTAESLLDKLINILDAHGALLDAARQSVIARELDRKLREEQDIAYQESLLLDQLKEQQQLIEQQNGTTCAESTHETQSNISQQGNITESDRNRKNAKRKKLELLPREPPENSANSAVIVIRMPNGSKLQRRFNITDTVQSVYDFADTQMGEDISKYELVSNFPFKEYKDKSESIQSANLYPQALLFLKESLS